MAENDLSQEAYVTGTVSAICMHFRKFGYATDGDSSCNTMWRSQLDRLSPSDAYEMASLPLNK